MSIVFKLWTFKKYLRKVLKDLIISKFFFKKKYTRWVELQMLIYFYLHKIQGDGCYKFEASRWTTIEGDKGAVVAVLSSPPSVLRFEGTGAIHRWLASRPRFGCTHTLYVVAVVVCTSFNAKTRAKVFFLH